MSKPDFRTDKEKLASIIRVDHAGEYGAKRIYTGQLRYTEDKSEKEKIMHMYNQEVEHYEYFNSQIIEQAVRPTILMPLWHIGGYFMGAATAFMSINYAMLCTKAVEDVIESHYAEQIENMPNNHTLKTKIIKFRNDELEHRDLASTYSEYNTIGHKVVSRIIKSICTNAIRISKIW